MMIYPILSVLCGCLAATAESSGRECVGGACVTDEGALIQKAAQATVGVERDEDLFRTSEHRVEFHMTEREFDNATELIPQKLRAQGVDAETYDPDNLMVFTASGAMMKSEPSRADFPLKMVLIPTKITPDFKDYQVTPMDMDMAMLADKVYTGATEGIKCWAHWASAIATDTSFFFATNRDRYSLHTCVCDYCKIPDSELKTCAFSFSGSNDAQDWLNNFDARGSASFCGGAQRHHGGFQKEANFLMENLAARKDWVEYMQGCGRIIFTGHSLGGAIATLFAGCVNCRSPECTDTRPALLDSFAKRGVAAELYTIGAPATTYGKEFKSEVSEDGVFPGVRFWTYTRKCFIVWGCQDPVPFGSLQLSFHPRMKAVGLGGRGGSMGWEGTTDQAIREPSSYMLFKASEHSAERYVNRLLMHTAKGKVDVPGPPPATVPIPPGPDVSLEPTTTPPVAVEKEKEEEVAKPEKEGKQKPPQAEPPKEEPPQEEPPQEEPPQEEPPEEEPPQEELPQEDSKEEQVKDPKVEEKKPEEGGEDTDDKANAEEEETNAEEEKTPTEQDAEDNAFSATSSTTSAANDQKEENSEQTDVKVKNNDGNNDEATQSKEVKDKAANDVEVEKDKDSEEDPVAEKRKEFRDNSRKFQEDAAKKNGVGVDPEDELTEEDEPEDEPEEEEEEVQAGD